MKLFLQGSSEEEDELAEAEADADAEDEVADAEADADAEEDLAKIEICQSVTSRQHKGQIVSEVRKGKSNRAPSSCHG